MGSAAPGTAAGEQHVTASVAATTTSTGHAQSSADWLDLHFEDCRPEYEAMLRSVGIAPGWRVLDAGCGGGAFLPLLAELVGPGGASPRSTWPRRT
jgi:2-polyprenyl-3-methyl-5-hydroxy-6-metoxy-1,4-benzoquinol methylase